VNTSLNRRWSQRRRSIPAAAHVIAVTEAAQHVRHDTIAAPAEKAKRGPRRRRAATLVLARASIRL